MFIVQKKSFRSCFVRWDGYTIAFDWFVPILFRELIRSVKRRISLKKNDDFAEEPERLARTSSKSAGG